MKIKKLISCLLCGCITAGLLVGCNNNKEDAGKNAGTEKNVSPEKNGIGKYVEQEVKVPVQENETILRLRKNTQGILELYVKNESEGSFYKYVSKDGKEWQREDAAWLSSVSNGELTSVAAGQDGGDYAIVTDENDVMHLLKRTDSGEAEEINVPELNTEDGTFYSFGTDIEVLENGNLVLEGNNEIRVYDAAGAKKLYSFRQEKSSTDARNPVSVSGNKIAIPDKDNKGFVVKNGEEEEAALDYGSDVREGRVILGEKNDIYFLDKKGIHHMQPDGSLVETLADGGNMMMGMPTVYVRDFVSGFQEDFYALYKTTNDEMIVKHYFYDKEAKVKTEKKLTIYSLKENKTVRQAVSVFQQKYPEAEIFYKTGASDGSATKADQIRVLNTELLNKNAADVLILDNLPVESFIEKGILKDISGVLNPLIEDGTLLKNIAECYQKKDGKIYSMPARYGVPILYGSQELIDAMDSLDNLEKWLEEHPKEPLMTEASYEQFNNLFVNMYYEELVGTDGKLKEEKVKQCLSCAKEAGERIQAEIKKEYSRDETAEEMPEISPWRAGNDLKILDGKSVSAAELQGIFDMIMPFGVMREKNLAPVWNKGRFVPHCIAGINSTTKETELSEAFIEILFSQEVQEYDLYDGLPVNQLAAEKMQEQGLDNLEQGKEDGMQVGVSGTEDGGTFSSGLPLKTEIESLFAGAKELKQPAEADSVLLEMIFEEAKMYYEGSKDLEEAVQGITSKVDTYRAE